MDLNKRVFQVNNGADITLWHGDCICGMQDCLPEKSVDVVVTSPPYNLGIDYSSYDDTLSRSEYLDWMSEWGAAVDRVLADDGSLFLNVGSKPTDPLVPFELLERMREHFVLQNVIHWVKSIAIMKQEVGNYPGITQDIVVGHYKPINSKRFLNDCHEYIFHFTKTGSVQLDRLSIGVPYQDKTNVARWASAGRDVHCRGNTWFIPYETIQSRENERPHPATFPVELPTRCIRIHGVERAKMVLDPFLGIGSSAIASARLGIPFVGFEMADDYYKESCHRLTSALEKP